MNIRGCALSILSAATFVACNSREDLVGPAESETESVQQALVSPRESKAGFAACDGTTELADVDAVTYWNDITLAAVIVASRVRPHVSAETSERLVSRSGDEPSEDTSLPILSRR